MDLGAAAPPWSSQPPVPAPGSVRCPSIINVAVSMALIRSRPCAALNLPGAIR